MNMTEFITRVCKAENHYEVIIKTSNENHYNAIQKLARELVDEANTKTDAERICAEGNHCETCGNDNFYGVSKE